MIDLGKKQQHPGLIYSTQDCGEYVTDSGLVVPAVSVQLRERLATVVANHGLGMDKQCEVRIL